WKKERSFEPQFATSATCLPSGANAAKRTPSPGRWPWKPFVTSPSFCRLDGDRENRAPVRRPGRAVDAERRVADAGARAAGRVDPDEAEVLVGAGAARPRVAADERDHLAVGREGGAPVVGAGGQGARARRVGWVDDPDPAGPRVAARAAPVRDEAPARLPGRLVLGV